MAVDRSAGQPDSEQPIRVALCVTELEPGGAERCLTELATRLDRREFVPQVYSLAARPAGARGVLVERLESAAIPVHFLGARSWLDAPAATLRLAGLLKAQRPQIVQTFLHHANVLGACAARLAGVGPTFTGVRVSERLKPWRAAALGWIDPWVARHICVSSGVADFVAAQSGLPRERLAVIPNGVDIEAASASAAGQRTIPGLPGGRGWIVCAARLDRQKGVDRLLTLAPDVLSALPGHDLLIVGRGDQWEPLQSLTRQSGYGSRIHWLGWRADLMRILASADVVVALSRWEGMSNVLLEAMAAARPIVTTSVEGVAELLGDAESIQVVPEGRLVEVPQRIMAIARNPKLQMTLGKLNSDRAQRCFAIARMVEQYAALFRAHARRTNERP